MTCTENEQNAVYCLARHYVAMHKQDFCNETASFFEACAGCKIINQCIGSRESDAGSKWLYMTQDLLKDFVLCIKFGNPKTSYQKYGLEIPIDHGEEKEART